MIRILSGTLCVLLILIISQTNIAALDLPDQDTKLWNRFLNTSNDVMISSLSLEVHYKQIPTSKINTSNLKSGNTPREVRKYLESFARVIVKNPVKTTSLTLSPGTYNLGLQEEKSGTGKWLFTISETNGKAITSMEPVFETLSPAMCTHVVTLELERKPGSNLLKIRVKLSDLSITTRDFIEL